MDDDINFGIIICAFMVALLVAGLVGSIVAHNKKMDELAADSCHLLREEKTGNRVYCGKACFRDEIREVYSCKSGEKTYIN